MTRFWIGLVLLAMLGWLGTAQAEGPMATAKRIVNEGLPDENVQACKTCHGPKGKSPVPRYPHLAGQHRSYLVHTLKTYRSGDRQHSIMARQAKPLSNRQIEALASYFATKQSALTLLPE